ncbi:MAG TPA: DUF1016 N-terminal domain-containing protein [Methanocorpusculum sp.]|nr:hypothetical protein [Candidatus Methanocorpusculum equi]MCQ2358151.1 DUF1016 N-terminal domain-containing protein [Methanocorpusculum sp.]HJJ33279.1 DUF1016 N-terminal domain-containing protein [Methanocorpusculum sp.]HJJ44967.1 DUF1016 N-terminal domain-containing protein [Methanocorpusculum sp.]HJJ58487.1 DUF1016 N-terminal domain-containing protein [Methanocorpusculum sp.]
MSDISFDGLISSIRSVDCQFTESAVRAVNVGLTLRNWCVGAYLSEFELHGAGRASYGERLFESVASRLKQYGMKRCDARELRRFMLFYAEYPQVFEVLPEEMKTSLLQVCSNDEEKRNNFIGDSSGENYSAESPHSVEERNILIQRIRDSVSPKFQSKNNCFDSMPVSYRTPAEKLVSSLSFTHIRTLLEIASPLKRLFYEVECMKGVWSVRNRYEVC